MLIGLSIKMSKNKVKKYSMFLIRQTPWTFDEGKIWELPERSILYVSPRPYWLHSGSRHCGITNTTIEDVIVTQSPFGWSQPGTCPADSRVTSGTVPVTKSDPCRSQKIPGTYRLVQQYHKDSPARTTSLFLCEPKPHWKSGASPSIIRSTNTLGNTTKPARRLSKSG